MQLCRAHIFLTSLITPTSVAQIVALSWCCTHNLNKIETSKTIKYMMLAFVPVVQAFCMLGGANGSVLDMSRGLGNHGVMYIHVCTL